MKKISLRTEYLGELSSDELRAVAGALGAEEMPGTVSDGSCVCTFLNLAIAIRCNVSAGSCACACGGA